MTTISNGMRDDVMTQIRLIVSSDLMAYNSQVLNPKIIGEVSKNIASYLMAMFDNAEDCIVEHSKEEHHG
jgi:hypothetical protein